MSRLKPIADAYKSTALVVFNTLLLLAVLNVALGFQRFYRSTLRPPNDPVSGTYGDKVLAAYPGETREDVLAMLRENWTRDLAFKPYTQFGERATNGRFVNVDGAGFRKVGMEQAPWPPSPERFNVFCLGGSTMFGYGVRDEQTIPARLQAALREKNPGGRAVAVYNFGQGWYQSTQQRIQLEELLVRGFKPDLVVSLDGLNDLHSEQVEEPAFSGQIREYVDGDKTWWGHTKRLAADLPVARVFARGASQIGGERLQTPEEARGVATGVLDRYALNQRLLRSAGTAMGFRTLFVWQPIPFHRFDATKNYPFGPIRGRDGLLRSEGYALMAQRFAAEPPAGDVLDLSGMQEGLSIVAYCDAVHYSPAMSELIARRIADRIVELGVVK